MTIRFYCLRGLFTCVSKVLGAPCRGIISLTNNLAIVSASMFRTGNISGHLVRYSVNTTIYLFPDHVTGRGPKQSTATLSHAPSTGIGRRGARKQSDDRKCVNQTYELIDIHTSQNDHTRNKGTATPNFAEHDLTLKHNTQPFWGSLVFMKQLIGKTERPDHATFSLAKSMTFPIFGNADTQSANHKQINFYPYLRTT